MVLNPHPYTLNSKPYSSAYKHGAMTESSCFRTCAKKYCAKDVCTKKSSVAVSTKKSSLGPWRICNAIYVCMVLNPHPYTLNRKPYSSAYKYGAMEKTWVCRHLLKQKCVKDKCVKNSSVDVSTKTSSLGLRKYEVEFACEWC